MFVGGDDTPAADERECPNPAGPPTLCEHECVTTDELWRRGQVGWPRRFPVVQFPNPPLLLAFAGWGLASRSDGTAHEVGRAVFTLCLAVWAWQETAGGVNWFRRLLVATALVWIVAGLTGEL